MDEKVDLEDYIEVVEPDGLTEVRLQELEFFKEYILAEEKGFITKNIEKLNAISLYDDSVCYLLLDLSLTSC